MHLIYHKIRQSMLSLVFINTKVMSFEMGYSTSLFKFDMSTANLALELKETQINA